MYLRVEKEIFLIKMGLTCFCGHTQTHTVVQELKVAKHVVRNNYKESTHSVRFHSSRPPFLRRLFPTTRARCQRSINGNIHELRLKDYRLLPYLTTELGFKLLVSYICIVIRACKTIVELF